MRGVRERDKSGADWLVCPACGTRLAVYDPARPDVLLWSRHWREPRNRPGVLTWARAKREKVGHGPDPIGSYTHPDATIAECPGRMIRGSRPTGCGEDVSLR